MQQNDNLVPELLGEYKRRVEHALANTMVLPQTISEMIANEAPYDMRFERGVEIRTQPFRQAFINLCLQFQASEARIKPELLSILSLLLDDYRLGQTERWRVQEVTKYLPNEDMLNNILVTLMPLAFKNDGTFEASFAIVVKETTALTQDMPTTEETFPEFLSQLAFSYENDYLKIPDTNTIKEVQANRGNLGPILKAVDTDRSWLAVNGERLQLAFKRRICYCDGSIKSYIDRSSADAAIIGTAWGVDPKLLANYILDDTLSHNPIWIPIAAYLALFITRVGLDAYCLEADELRRHPEVVTPKDEAITLTFKGETLTLGDEDSASDT